MKICHRCKIEQPLENFRPFVIKNEKKNYGQTGYRPYCHPCEKEYRTEHYKKNKEKYDEKRIRWRKENPEAWKELCKKHNNKPENIALRKSEEYKAKQRAHNKNPHRRAKLNERQRLRDHKIYRDTLGLTEDEKRQIDEIYLKATLMSRNGSDRYHVDHIIPISKGGKHHPDNLQILLAVDNMKKGNRACQNTM